MYNAEFPELCRQGIWNFFSRMSRTISGILGRDPQGWPRGAKPKNNHWSARHTVNGVDFGRMLNIRETGGRVGFMVTMGNSELAIAFLVCNRNRFLGFGVSFW